MGRAGTRTVWTDRPCLILSLGYLTAVGMFIEHLLYSRSA